MLRSFILELRNLRCFSNDALLSSVEGGFHGLPQAIGGNSIDTDRRSPKHTFMYSWSIICSLPSDDSLVKKPSRTPRDILHSLSGRKPLERNIHVGVTLTSRSYKSKSSTSVWNYQDWFWNKHSNTGITIGESKGKRFSFPLKVKRKFEWVSTPGVPSLTGSKLRKRPTFEKSKRNTEHNGLKEEPPFYKEQTSCNDAITSLFVLLWKGCRKWTAGRSVDTRTRPELTWRRWTKTVVSGHENGGSF